jgi:hypothetical protein
VILAALAAALGAWILGESGVMKAVPANSAIPTVSAVIMAPTAATTEAADIKNSARLFGTFGALLGLLLGLASGWARRNTRTAAVAGAVGLLAGGVTGAIAPIVVLPAYYRWSAQGTDGLIISVVMHSGLWIALGAAAGLALGIGSSKRWRLAQSAMGGALGAVSGAVIYDLLGAMIFPFAQTGDPFAITSSARLLEFLIPGLAIALGAARGARG